MFPVFNSADVDRRTVVELFHLLLQLFHEVDYRMDTLDRCHTCNFIAQHCRATLLKDKIASVTLRVAQLYNSCATLFSNRAVLYSVLIYRENAVNVDWSILVYATILQCVTCTVAYCNFENRAIKLQV